jgi:hypothetical protein
MNTLGVPEPIAILFMQTGNLPAPSQWLGVPELIVILLVGVVVIWLPWSRIFSKAGYSSWLSLAMFVPLVNIILLFWFAFSEWPIIRRRD